MRTRVSRFLPGLIGLLAAVACSDSTGPSVLSLEKIAGNWRLTQSEFLMASDTTVRHDQTGELDATLSIDRNGTTSLTVNFAGQGPMTVAGTIAVRGDTISWELEGSGSTYLAIARLSGRSMTWLSIESYLYDVNNDGVPEESLERDVWQRQ